MIFYYAGTAMQGPENGHLVALCEQGGEHTLVTFAELINMKPGRLELLNQIKADNTKEPE